MIIPWISKKAILIVIICAAIEDQNIFHSVLMISLYVVTRCYYERKTNIHLVSTNHIKPIYSLCFYQAQ